MNVNSHWGNFPVVVFQPGAIPVYPVGDKPHLFLNILTTLPGMIQGFQKPVVNCCYGGNKSLLGQRFKDDINPTSKSNYSTDKIIKSANLNQRLKKKSVLVTCLVT